MVCMIYINTKIFELFDQKFDLVLFWIPAHISEFFVLIPGNDFVDDPGNSIGNGDFGFIGGAKSKFPMIVLGAVKGAAF